MGWEGEGISETENVTPGPSGAEQGAWSSPVGNRGPALVRAGCCTNIPSSVGFNDAHFFLTVLEAGKIQLLVRALSLARRQLPSHCVLP